MAGLGFLTCLLGVLYSLFVNHLLPIKAGDLVRMKIMSTRDDISGEDAAHSVIILRLLDMIFLIGFTIIGFLVLGVDFQISIPLVTYWMHWTCACNRRCCTVFSSLFKASV